MSDPSDTRASLRQRLLVQAMQAAPPPSHQNEPRPAEAGSADDGECTVCDVIAQRLAGRAGVCAPQPADPVENRAPLRLAASLHYATPAEDTKTSWESTLGELNAALEIARGNLQSQDDWPALTTVQASGDGEQVSYDGAIATLDARPQELTEAADAGAVFEPQELVSRPRRAPPSMLRRMTQSAARRLDTFRARGGAVLAGLALLIMMLGLLPFAPTVLGSLVEDTFLSDSTPRRTRETPSHAVKPPVSEERPSRAADEPTTRQTAEVRATRAQVRDLKVAPIQRVQAGATVSLDAVADTVEGQSPGAFAAIRGFPAGASFSNGQALGPSLWTVPVELLADLRITVPHDAPDVSLVTIEVLGPDSALQAQASLALVVSKAEGASAVRATDRPQPRTGRDDAAWVTLMTVARHRLTMVAGPLSWSRVEPRRDLLHVSLPAMVQEVREPEDARRLLPGIVSELRREPPNGGRTEVAAVASAGTVFEVPSSVNDAGRALDAMIDLPRAARVQVKRPLKPAAMPVKAPDADEEAAKVEAKSDSKSGTTSSPDSVEKRSKRAAAPAPETRLGGPAAGKTPVPLRVRPPALPAAPSGKAPSRNDMYDVGKGI